MVEIVYANSYKIRDGIGKSGKMITESRDTIEGGGQRGNRAENIRSYYRHPIKVEGGSCWNCSNGLYLQIEILLSLSLPFSLLVSCPIVHDKVQKFHCTAFDSFSREKNFQRIFHARTFSVTCSTITDRCYCSPMNSRDL